MQMWHLHHDLFDVPSSADWIQSSTHQLQPTFRTKGDQIRLYREVQELRGLLQDIMKPYGVVESGRIEKEDEEKEE